MSDSSSPPSSILVTPRNSTSLRSSTRTRVPADHYGSFANPDDFSADEDEGEYDDAEEEDDESWNDKAQALIDAEGLEDEEEGDMGEGDASEEEVAAVEQSKKSKKSRSSNKQPIKKDSKGKGREKPISTKSKKASSALPTSKASVKKVEIKARPNLAQRKIDTKCAFRPSAASKKLRSKEFIESDDEERTGGSNGENSDPDNNDMLSKNKAKSSSSKRSMVAKGNKRDEIQRMPSPTIEEEDDDPLSESDVFGKVGIEAEKIQTGIVRKSTNTKKTKAPIVTPKTVKAASALPSATMATTSSKRPTAKGIVLAPAKNKPTAVATASGGQGKFSTIDKRANAAKSLKQNDNAKSAIAAMGRKQAVNAMKATAPVPKTKEDPEEKHQELPGAQGSEEENNEQPEVDAENDFDSATFKIKVDPAQDFPPTPPISRPQSTTATPDSTAKESCSSSTSDRVYVDLPSSKARKTSSIECHRQGHQASETTKVAPSPTEESIEESQFQTAEDDNIMSDIEGVLAEQSQDSNAIDIMSKVKVEESGEEFEESQIPVSLLRKLWKDSRTSKQVQTFHEVAEEEPVDYVQVDIGSLDQRAAPEESQIASPLQVNKKRKIHGHLSPTSSFSASTPTPAPARKKLAPAEKVTSAQRALIIDAFLNPTYLKSLRFEAIATPAMASAKLNRHWREVLGPDIKSQFAGGSNGSSAKRSLPSKNNRGNGVSAEWRRKIWEEVVCKNYDKADWARIHKQAEGQSTTKLKRHFRDVMRKEVSQFIEA